MLNNNFIQASTSSELQNNEFVKERMSGIARYIYETFSSIDAAGNDDYKIAGYITFFTIFLLCVVVYKLGFAKQIKVWQNLIIYTFLFVGCILLTFFSFFLPIIEGLIVAALVLIIYKMRMRLEKRQEKNAAS